MADNVQITSGANSTPPDGTIVATDDVGGVQFQRVKLDVGGDGVSVPVTTSGLPITGTVTANAGSNLNTSALALDATVLAQSVLVGAVNETAPASDTASSGLNGRLQRIAQRLTSLIALLPASLGQKNMAGSLAVTVASDQSAIPVTDNSGSLTVDAPVATPVFVRLSDGTSALTTTSGRLSVDASGVAVPVTDNAGSLTVDNNGTFAVQTGSSAADAATTIPSVDVIAGWDGINVRSAFMQSLDGHNTLFTHDNLNRRLLEDMLVEQRTTNALLAKLLGVQAPTQREMEPGLRLVS